jgi:hypothetical protein
VVVERDGLALHITRNRDSTTTDEMYCSWSNDRRGRVDMAELRQLFSPHRVPTQRPRDLRPNVLPQKRPWAPGLQQARGERPAGNRGPSRDEGDLAREGQRHRGAHRGGGGPGRGGAAHPRR